MKILLIGANGTIGKQVGAHFSRQHKVVKAGRTTAEIKVDIADSSSIKKMFTQLGTVDAIVCCAGEAKWAPLSELNQDDYYIGIKSKLMGQVNLVRIGQHYLNLPGSITLTTGILADQPVPQTASAAMVNGALHSFVLAASAELPAGIRLNVVSPGLVADSAEKYKDYFPGQQPVLMERVVRGFARSVEGRENGEIIRIYNDTK